MPGSLQRRRSIFSIASFVEIRQEKAAAPVSDWPWSAPLLNCTMARLIFPARLAGAAVFA